MIWPGCVCGCPPPHRHPLRRGAWSWTGRSERVQRGVLPLLRGRLAAGCLAAPACCGWPWQRRSGPRTWRPCSGGLCLSPPGPFNGSHKGLSTHSDGGREGGMVVCVWGGFGGGVKQKQPESKQNTESTTDLSHNSKRVKKKTDL